MKKIINKIEYKKFIAMPLLGVLFVLSCLLGGCYDSYELTSETVQATQETSYVDEYYEEVADEVDAETTVAQTTEQLSEYLTFRYDDYLYEHYEKHGIDMGFESAQDYLDAANAVVYNPSSLHKIEEEDGDDVYYLEITNEFVVVSTDGYIRTYFNPSDGIDYFNRQ